MAPIMGVANYAGRLDRHDIGRTMLIASGSRSMPESRPSLIGAVHLYCFCRRKPAMAINGLRNKPFGPGGSTRRLHQSPPLKDHLWRVLAGAN